MDPATIEAWHQTCEIVKKHAMLWHTTLFEPFHIFVDSSDFASGSVLMHKKDGNLRPVAFHSKVFTTTEQNYSASERDMLGGDACFG